LPVTSFDIPEELNTLIENLVRSGAARNRREIIIRALEIYYKYEVYRWREPLIFMSGFRHAMLSKGSLSGLIADMSEEELYSAGKRMGKSLRDFAHQRAVDITLEKNRTKALEILENAGWGKFAINGKRVTVNEPFFPATLIQGYLESALSLTLKKIDTTEDVVIFGYEKS
jgi:Arc/MetJ-type ribon-helix-helix transcriptional regulator